MDDQLGKHQQGDADEETDMGLDVQQEGHGHAPAGCPPSRTAAGGEPADPAQDEDTSPGYGLDIAKVGPAPQLVEGPPRMREKLAGSGKLRESGSGGATGLWWDMR